MRKKQLLKDYKESLRAEIFDYSTVNDKESFNLLTIACKEKVVLSKINKKISADCNDVGFANFDNSHLIHDTPLCFVFSNNKEVGLKDYEIDFLINHSKLEGFTLWNGSTPVMHALCGVADLQVELSEEQWWNLLNNSALEGFADKNKGSETPTLLMVASYYLSGCKSKLTEAQWEYLLKCSDIDYAIDNMMKMPDYDYLEEKKLNGFLFLKSIKEKKVLSMVLTDSDSLSEVKKV